MSSAPARPAEGGSTLREASRLAWPATLSLLLHSGYRVNDQYWVQRLGPDAQAALGVTAFMLILNFAFITLAYGGVLARVARFTGSREPDAVKEVVRSGFRFALAWFAAVSALGWLSSPLWVELLGASGRVAEWSEIYLRRIYLGLTLMALKPMTDAVFIGMGNTLVPMLLSALAVGLNFVLNPLLIYGIGRFEGMGIAGAAWATVISRGFGGLLGAVILWRVHGLAPSWLGRFRRAEVAAIVRIGVPMALSTAGYSLVFIAVLKTSVEPLGSLVQAGLGVAFNGVEAISYCALLGPAVAAASMVGRRLGAGDLPGAHAAVRACMALSIGISLVFTGGFLLAPRALAGFYTDNPQVLAEAALYLWVVGWSQALTAASSVYEQALAGAGRTSLLAVVNGVGNGIRIPLAWAMAGPAGLGAAGVWWALNLSNFLKLAAIAPLARRELRVAGVAVGGCAPT